MKKLVVLLVVAAAMLLLVPFVGAQGGLSYDSGFQVQNLADVDANVTIEYYDQDGTVNTSISDVIPAGSSKTYFPIDPAAGFNGSVVVSSDQEVAAIVNVLANSFAYGASYDGFTSGTDSVSLPLIMKENSGYSTWFNVQNAGADAVDVDVAYAGTACTDSATIMPGAAHTFDQETNTCLTAGYVGAGTVTAAGGSVVATVMEVGPTTLFAYNGFTGGSTNPVVPLVNANNSGYITGIQIQNTGAASTDVEVSYTAITGADCSETKTIPAGGSATFALYSFSLGGDPDPGTNDCAFGDTFIGSAEVTANSASNDLVGIVNQLNPGDDKGSSYSAFDAGNATSSVVMPLIMDRNSGYYTGFNVQNVGSGNTVVTCEFTKVDGTSGGTAVSGTLASGDAFNHIQDNELGDGWVGSAICSASDSGSIIGVVNELGSGSGDQFFTYEGFNN
jgi:hypothetical protein